MPVEGIQMLTRVSNLFVHLRMIFVGQFEQDSWIVLHRLQSYITTVCAKFVSFHNTCNT